MPKTIAHMMVLSDQIARLRTQFTTEGKTVTQLLVQLEMFHLGEWRTVRRCDDHHGRPHIDCYNYRGEQYEKRWLDCDRNQALTWARSDFKQNWVRYADEFYGG